MQTAMDGVMRYSPNNIGATKDEHDSCHRSVFSCIKTQKQQKNNAAG